MLWVKGSELRLWSGTEEHGERGEPCRNVTALLLGNTGLEGKPYPVELMESWSRNPSSM